AGRIIDHGNAVKVAVSHGLGWHGDGGRNHALAHPEALVVDEVEGMVLANRSARAAAKLVLAVFRLRCAGNETERCRVHLVVAEKLIQAAVKLIGSGLRNKIDHASRGTSDLSSIQTGLNAELGQCFDGWPDDGGTDNAVVVIDAVDHEIIDLA